MPYLSYRDGLWVVNGSLLSHLRQLISRHDVRQFLLAIAMLTALRSGGAEQQEQLERIAREAKADSLRAFRPFQLSLLAKMTLEENSLPQYPRAVHTEDLLSYGRMLLQIMGDVEETIVEIEDTGYKGKAAWGMLFRIANLQFPDFEGLFDHLPRALLLYRRLPQIKSYDFNPAEAFINITNGILSLDEFWFIGMGIVSLSLLYPGKPVSIKQIADSPELKGLDTKKVETFLEFAGIRPEDFSKLAQDPKVNWDGYQIYDYNQLVERPIVMLDNGRFVVPVPRLLIERISSGLYYIFIKDYGQTFSSAMGIIFQDYVDFLLQNSIQSGQIISEAEYSKVMQHGPLPDFLVLDGDSLLIVDVAMARISAETKAMADKDKLKQELQREDHIIDHLSKLYQVQCEIPRFAVTHTEFTKVRRVVSLLVLMDRFYWANDFFTRQIIDELLQSRNVDTRRFAFQIIHAPEFERLTALSQRQSLIELVIRKADDPEAKFWQFKQFIFKRSQELGVDFINLEDPNLRKTFEEEWESIIGRFGRE